MITEICVGSEIEQVPAPDGADDFDGLLAEHTWDELRLLLQQIPARERFVLALLARGLKQQEVAHDLTLTQEAVHYLRMRAIARLRFLANGLSLPAGDELRDMLSTVLPAHQVVIVAGLLNNPCQSLLARKLGRSQSYIRSAWMEALEAIGSATANETLELIYARMREITDNRLWNILRPVASGHRGPRKRAA